MEPMDEATAQAGKDALLIELINMLVERGVIDNEAVMEVTRRAIEKREKYRKDTDQS